MTIATTINQQIGNRALTMMGAHCLADHGDAFSFKFKGSKVANYLKVTLAVDDTYTLDFKRLGRGALGKVTDVREIPMIYADQLADVIENVTGLYLSL